MASSQDYLIYVMELLKGVDGVHYKKMMGEYIIYVNNTIIGGIYDNRFLVKKCECISHEGYKEEIPYPTGKKMYLIDNENPDDIKEIVEKIYEELTTKR